jgi:hypothetical protein
VASISGPVVRCHLWWEDLVLGKLLFGIPERSQPLGLAGPQKVDVHCAARVIEQRAQPWWHYGSERFSTACLVAAGPIGRMGRMGQMRVFIDAVPPFYVFFTHYDFHGLRIYSRPARILSLLSATVRRDWTWFKSDWAALKAVRALASLPA